MVIKSGNNPPDGPFGFWVKNYINELPSTCGGLANPRTGYITTPVNLNETGTVLVKPTWVSFDYDWPPRVYGGEFYQ
jgi:hypothetical protein